jgi:hypothetical protein
MPVWSRMESPGRDLRTHCQTPPPDTTDPGTRRQFAAQPVTSNAAQKCVSSYSGKEVPCKEGNSWWSNDRDCYVSLADLAAQVRPAVGGPQNRRDL